MYPPPQTQVSPDILPIPIIRFPVKEKTRVIGNIL